MNDHEDRFFYDPEDRSTDLLELNKVEKKMLKDMCWLFTACSVIVFEVALQYMDENSEIECQEFRV